MPAKFKDVKWEKVDPNEGIKYLQLDEVPQMIEEPFKPRLDFWKSLNLNDLDAPRRRTVPETSSSANNLNKGSAEVIA